MNANGRISKIKIGERWVGEGEPCFIVAEAGSNHNGDYEKALQLIDMAAQAGADAVKFQHFKAAKLYPRSAGKSDYLQNPKPIYDIIHEMEMPDDWVPRLAEYCEKRNIVFLSSPFDEASADLLASFVPAFKVASYEMTHVPLLEHIARKLKPIILSTGTASLSEVTHSVETIRGLGNDELVLLQCTASYPTPLDSVNVRALVALREATGLPTGLSDHSRDPIIAPVVAVALGACLIEKHFTLSNDLPGPDHRFAVEPDELAQMVRSIREAEQALGNGVKEALPVERELLGFARRSIFVTSTIRRGEELNSENIAVLRCGKLGYGLAPDEYGNLVGHRAARDLSADTLLTWEDVE